MIVPAAILALQVGTLTVGPGGAFATVGEALAAARPGDTVRVTAGIYHERLVVRTPVVLLGEPGAVLDGGGAGVVLTIHAGATVRGFTIRGSGANQAQEDAGILASSAHGLVVEENRFEDVLFGVYAKQTDGALIRRNTIVGKAVPVPLRGDGIRLWYCRRARIEENVVRGVRDIVIWFSDSVAAVGNYVGESRYGLHYMYSNHNRFEDNEFIANDVGAFIMYSADITFRRNVFANARGTTGRGLGFKDADRITAEGNVLVKNAVGISIDNSPHSTGVTNRFSGNIVAYNDVGVSLLPSVHSNAFTANQFLDNVVPVRISGGGTALANHWQDNYWSDYAGFDADGDGRGDTPFVFERLSDDVLAKHEPLQLFQLSTAVTALNVLGRVLPLLQPQPLVVDSAPRIAPAAVAGTGGRRSALAAAGFLAAALLALGAAPRLRRPFRSRP